MDFPYQTVDVKCERDPGFIRDVRVYYTLTKSERRIFINAQCKMHGRTETCYRCCDLLTNALNRQDHIPPQPIALNFTLEKQL